MHSYPSQQTYGIVMTVAARFWSVLFITQKREAQLTKERRFSASILILSGPHRQQPPRTTPPQTVVLCACVARSTNLSAHASSFPDPSFQVRDTGS